MKYLRKTFERCKPGWFTILANWNICIFKIQSEALQREKNQLNCILHIKALIKFRREFQVLQKVFFEPNSIAVSWRLLNRETRLYLKFENSLILS